MRSAETGAFARVFMFWGGMFWGGSAADACSNLNPPIGWHLEIVIKVCISSQAIRGKTVAVMHFSKSTRRGKINLLQDILTGLK
jgi:hypothetical protein